MYVKQLPYRKPAGPSGANPALVNSLASLPYAIPKLDEWFPCLSGEDDDVDLPVR